MLMSAKTNQGCGGAHPIKGQQGDMLGYAQDHRLGGCSEGASIRKDTIESTGKTEPGC